jgi:6-phosphofructokinase 2
MKRIVTLTINPAVDKSARVEQVVPERKLRCRMPRFDPGGGGINVSRAIKTLGGESVALFPYGGPLGQMLQKLLGEEGIQQIPVPIAGLSRENLIVYEESSGQQFRFGMPGPKLEEDEWRQCLEMLSDLDPKPDYVVASGSLPPGVPTDFYARVSRAASDRGIRLILDSSGEALRLAANVEVYLLKPNLRELRSLGDEGDNEPFDPEKAAMKLVQNRNIQIVVVSLGAAGALLVSSEGAERFHAPTVPIESKVGAGDSMVAGIVLRLAQGVPLRDAVRFGVAAGAAAVMTPGTELCRKEDTERLFQMMGRGNP